jgi:hypothetical protein
MRLDTFTNVGDGQLHIHKHGCRDTRQVKYRFTDKLDQGENDWPSKEAYGSDYWQDINAEQDDVVYDWQDSDLNWFPCTDDLREWETD